MVSVATRVLHTKACTTDPRYQQISQPTPLTWGGTGSPASFSPFLQEDRDRNRSISCTYSQVKGKTEAEIREDKTKKEGKKTTFFLVLPCLKQSLVSFQLNSVLCSHSPPVVTQTFCSLPLPAADPLQPYPSERLPFCFSPNPNPHPIPTAWL